MQVEDRGADLLDDGLQLVDGVGEPLLHLRGAGPGDGALQREPDGEQSLDHVVVQIAGDPVAVGRPRRAPACGAGCWPAARPGWPDRRRRPSSSSCSSLNSRASRSRSTTTNPATVSVVRSGSTSAGPASDPNAGPNAAAASAAVSRSGVRLVKAVPITLSTKWIGANDRGSAAEPAVSTTTNSSTSEGSGASSSRGTATSTVSCVGQSQRLVGDQPKHPRRARPPQQLGRDVAGRLDPGLPCPGLLVEPRVVDRDAGGGGQRLHQHLVVFAERLAAGLLGEVEVAVDLVADAHRHAEERVHRRVVGGKAHRVGVHPDVVEANRLGICHAAPREHRGPRAVARCADGSPRRCRRRRTRRVPRGRRGRRARRNGRRRVSWRCARWSRKVLSRSSPEVTTSMASTRPSRRSRPLTIWSTRSCTSTSSSRSRSWERVSRSGGAWSRRPRSPRGQPSRRRRC